MFIIKIDYLLSSASAKSFINYQSAVEWPPHPGRLFQALVDAWGRNSESSDGADALIALESQNSPQILVPPVSSCVVNGYGVRASNVTLAKDVRTINNRKIKVRVFNGHEIKPGDGVSEFFTHIYPDVADPSYCFSVYMVWASFSPRESVLSALRDIVGNVPYLGKSTSVVSISIVDSVDYDSVNGMDTYTPTENACGFRFRVPYKGYLKRLVDCHKASLVDGKGKKVSLAKVEPKYVFYSSSSDDTDNIYESVSPWDLLFSFAIKSATSATDKGILRPSIHNLARITREIRSKFIRLLDNNSSKVKCFVSGHNHDGSVMKSPHLAILPLANVGHKNHPDANLHGIVLAVPKGTDKCVIDGIRSLILKVVDTPDLLIDSQWVLVPASIDESFSLDFRRYGKPSTTWSTVTPVVVDCHLPPRGKKEEKRRARLHKMFTKAGYPEPKSVALHDVSTFSEVPASRSFNEDDLNRKAGYQRQVRHMTVTFDSPVCGPILIGAGSYRGFGLMLPR